MNNRLYGNLIFELSKEGRIGYSLPGNNFGNYEVPKSLCRAADAELPECDEMTVVRHYTTSPTTTLALIQASIRWEVVP